MSFDGDLLAAASSRQSNELLALVRKGADVNAKNKRGRTPLLIAAHHGHHVTCKILLENGAFVNYARSNGGYSALHEASSWGHGKVVKLLLQKGADLNIKTNSSYTALHLASLNGHVGIVTRLLSQGADINEVGYNSNTALHEASAAGHKDLVLHLLQNGAKVDAINDSSETPTVLAEKKKYYEIVDILEKYLLYEASLGGQYDLCKILVAKGTTRNLVDVFETHYPFNPARAALKGGYSEIVKLFLHSQLDIDYDKIVKEVPPIFLATERGHEEVLSFLLTCGADPDTAVNGDAILHLATRKRRADLVRLLLHKGANPNIEDKLGRTPLHYAVINGDEAVVAELVEHAANVNAVVRNGQTVLHLALSGIHYKITQLLIRKGANLETRNDQNETSFDVFNRKATEHQRITDMISGLNWIQNESAAGNCSSNDLLQDITSDGSDSDETVEYPSLQDLDDFSVLEQEDATLQLSNIEHLQSKMDELMALVLEINDIAVGVNQLKVDLMREIKNVANLQLRIDNNRRMGELKNKSTHEKTKCEMALKILMENQDEAKYKESQLRVKIESAEVSIHDLKAKKKMVYVEIGELL